MPDWTAAEEAVGRCAFDSYRYTNSYPVAWDWADMSENERRGWVERGRESSRRPFDKASPGQVVMIGRTAVAITSEVQDAIAGHQDRMEAGEGTWTELVGQRVFRCQVACAFCDSRWKATQRLSPTQP